MKSRSGSQRSLAARWFVGVASVASVAMMVTMGSGCIKEKDSLVVVSLTAEVDLPTATQAILTVAGVTRTFPLTAGLSMTTPVQRGVYIGSDATGNISVSGVVEAGSPCVRYAQSATVRVASAGSTVPVSLRLVAAGSCTGTGTDAGAGADSQSHPDLGPGAGGTTGTGGAATGGTTGTGGRLGTGGTPATGGTMGTGGAAGGATGTGGAGGVILSPPSLSRCTELFHAANPACNLDSDPTVGDVSLWSVVFSPDGKLLLSAGDDGRIRFWTVSATAVPTPDGRELSTNGQAYLAISHNGKYLAAGASNGTITVWNLTATPTIYATLTGHTDAVDQVVFSPDDARLISVGEDKMLIVWSMIARASTARITLSDFPWSVDVSSQTTATSLPVAVTQGDGNVVLMNALSPLMPVPMQTYLVGTDSTWGAEGVAFSPDGTNLALGSEDGSLSLWAGAAVQRITRVSPDFLPPLTSGNYQAVKAVSFFPSGLHVAAATGTAFDGGQLAIFAKATHQLVSSKIPQYYPLSVAVSPDGGAVVVGEVDCGILLYCRD